MTRDADRPADTPANDEAFLQRWSRRKHAHSRAAAAEQTPPAIEAHPAPTAPPAEERTLPAVPATLPAVESLTFESDFRAFLQPHVADDLKRQALRKLLRDPRFNVMDGLDVYIDDYSVASPLEPALARALAQARYIFEPPRTRVNARGQVEDVPAEEDQAHPVAAQSEPVLCEPEASGQSAHASAVPPEEALAPVIAAAARAGLPFEPDAADGTAMRRVKDAAP